MANGHEPHWLTPSQAEAHMAAPGTGTLMGLRDTAIITLGYCTGAREFELQALVVDDLRHRSDDELCLLVRHGKWDRRRVIPYGKLSWCLKAVDAWLDAAGITEGWVFRAFWKGARRLRPSRLSLKSFQSICKSYPVEIGGELVTVRPHDLRRTYARLQFQAGMTVPKLSVNMGHKNMGGTRVYLGPLDTAPPTRRCRGVYADCAQDPHAR